MNPFIKEVFIQEEWRALTKNHISELCSDTKYLVSNIGRVYDNENNRFVSISNSGNGYCCVSLKMIKKYKTFFIHRLVSLVFLNNFHSETNNVVNHKNGIKNWNTVNNLEWTTSSANNQHAYDNNLKLKGEDCSMSKLTEVQVKKICSLLETNMNVVDIINEVGGNVLTSDIYDIMHKKCWVDISNNYNFYTGKRVDNMRNFNEDKVKILCQYFQDHPKPDNISIIKHCEEALKTCNFDYSWQSINTLRKIYIKYTYKNISKDYIF